MHLWKSRMKVWPNCKGQNWWVKKLIESHNAALFFHFFTAIKVALSWHFVSMWKQNRPKMVKSDNKSFILWPVCILPLYKCVFFPNLSVTYATFLLNCLKVGGLYFRVLYIKQNLPHHLFSMWNMSLICSPMPEKRWVSKYPWTFGHPVDSNDYRLTETKPQTVIQTIPHCNRRAGRTGHGV